jgi:hypothetical protein
MGILKHIRNKDRIYFDFIACLLIVLFHFANYITYAEYSRFFPDILLIIVLLSGVALLLTGLLQIPSTTFRVIIFTVLINIVIGEAIYEFGVADVSIRLVAMTITVLIVLGLVFCLRKHLNKVLIAAFLAMLFSTLVIGQMERFGGDRPVNSVAIKGASKPIILHVILDEHIGLAGMTSDLPAGSTVRRAVRDFYLGAGFRLFANAYSPYFETSMSLASAMNFSEGMKPNKFLTDRLYGFSLDQNRYLKEMSARGFQINVYQSNYFDLCNAQSVSIEKCTTYKPDSLSAPEIEKLPLSSRMHLVTSMYVSSMAVVRALKIIEHPVRIWLQNQGIDIPKLGFWHGRIGPLAVARTLSELENDLIHTKGTTLLLAHFLMPHYPYVYSADCEIRLPVSDWKLRQPDNGRNTSQMRNERYRDYFDQLKCTMKKLTRLFDAMKRAGTFKDATIIIHGDHGSRINTTGTALPRRQAMSNSDYHDDFSTLFAIKSPDLAPAIDLRQLSLPRLLAFAAQGSGKNLLKLERPSVFLRGDPTRYVKTPLPDFSRDSQ